MYICLCHGVSDSKLDELLDQGARSMLELQKHCQAGTDCGACLKDIRQRLLEKRASAKSRQIGE